MSGVEHGTSVFWDDLARELEDPEALRHYVAESARIATFNSLVNGFRDALEAAGLSQGALAESIPANAAAIRRLMSRGHLNPTLSTLSAVASGLGLRLTLEPIPEPERALITGALATGRTDSPDALIDALETAKRVEREPARARKASSKAAKKRVDA